MTNSKSVTCSQKSHECNITLAGEHHSGSYWCDSNSGERGEAVNITVTGMCGSLSPVGFLSTLTNYKDIYLACVQCLVQSLVDGFTVCCVSTEGSVILGSPVHPVPEGSPVTLRCLTSHTSSKNLVVVTRINQSCTFSRDGRLIGVGLTGEMSFAAVNRSHEGLYHSLVLSLQGAGWLSEVSSVWSPHGEVLQSH